MRIFFAFQRTAMHFRPQNPAGSASPLWSSPRLAKVAHFLETQEYELLLQVLAHCLLLQAVYEFLLQVLALLLELLKIKRGSQALLLGRLPAKRSRFAVALAARELQQRVLWQTLEEMQRQ